MKIERTRNTGRNIATGLMMKVLQMLLPFIMRTMMIYCMGEEYLGLNSLFTSILQVLNLAELGVGSAMVFFMYKPIAEDDDAKLCALMKLYRTYYRVIGLVIAALGLALLPFLQYFISGSVPSELSIQKLYLMNLAATVLSYWLFAYRSSIISAYQRDDAGNYITMGATLLQYGLQAVILLFFKNYYLYVLVILVTQVLSNIAGAILSKKMYPNLDPKGSISKEERKAINAKIRDLFIARLGGVVLCSADTIIISAFLGLSALAVYQNYFFIVSSICGFLEMTLGAIRAGIGNSMITESEEDNLRIFHKVSILFTWLVFICVSCFAGIFQPFMKIWMGEELMLPYGMVFSYCMYFIVYEYTRLFNTFKSAAGQWHEDRFRPLISAVTNLCLNLATVKIFQLYGILWSSILALGVIEIPWLIHNIMQKVYPYEKLGNYLKILVRYLLAGVAACGITALVSNLLNLPDWPKFLLCTLISAVIPTVLYPICFRKQSAFAECVEMLERMTKNKIPLRKLFLIR